MSSRALRKAQREREEQEQAKKLQRQQEEDEQEDDAGVSLPQAKKSAFEMLNQVDEDETAADDDEDANAQSDLEEDDGKVDDMPVAPAQPKSAGKKKKKKKAKAKAKAPAEAPVEKDVDEIDEALRQLSTSNGNAAAPATTSAGSDPVVNEASSLLAIDTAHLHAQNEMRRLFGRAALDAQDDEEGGAGGAAAGGGGGGNRRRQRQGQQMGLAGQLRGQHAQGGRGSGLASLSLRRNIFIQGKEEWPAATGGGLSMEVVEKHADGTIEYRYAHNGGYQDVQSQFETCVASMDPNRLVMLLRHNPYHISTLLQVSEIAKQDRDHATSGDLLERALFSFGRAVHSTFAKSLAEGKARLDFRRPENREFWLAGWRYMQNLTMRATWRTVYEWAKLLLSLAPEDDPYNLWLVLDQYALRARQDIDFLNVSRNVVFKAIHDSTPNIQISQALAEHRAGNQSKGKQALFTAVGRFPWVVARLMQELSLDPPPAVWGKEPRTEREKLHTELYATRAKDLWNTPETSALLLEIASALPPDTIEPAPADTEEITEREARHVLLSDTPALTSLIPRKWTARLTSSSDPLPPADSITTYTPSRASASAPQPTGPRSPAQDLGELQGLYNFFGNLFPWLNPAGTAGEGDGAADGEVPRMQHPSEEEIERRIEESGVPEQEIAARTRRMVELQQRLMAQVEGGDADEAEDAEEQLRRLEGEEGAI
ncbi:hypothetical protein MBLNU230_g1610t1 [Neophaeotheca triangularis]